MATAVKPASAAKSVTTAKSAPDTKSASAASVSAPDRPAVVDAPRTPGQIAVIVVAVLASIAAARIAEPFLVPVVLGILLSYPLRPLVTWLERARIPRMAGAAIVLGVLLAIISGAMYGLRDQANAAVAELPSVARKLRYAAAESPHNPPGPMSQVKAAAAELDRAAAEATGMRPAAPQLPAVAQPPAVTPPPAGAVTAQLQGFLAEQSSHALGVISQILLALLLTFFLLASGDTFRRKGTKIAGASLARRRVTVEALNEIDDQIQAYMVTLLLANVLIALATWGALALLDVPHAGMWGAFTGILHVVPYAGAMIAAGTVGIAAFAGSGVLGDALLAMALVLAITAIIGIGLATWMQGRVTRINPVAVFIGVLFFGWLWGGWGLLVGVPLIAVLKSVADRVESMHPIRELLAP